MPSTWSTPRWCRPDTRSADRRELDDHLGLHAAPDPHRVCALRQRPVSLSRALWPDYPATVCYVAIGARFQAAGRAWPTGSPSDGATGSQARAAPCPVRLCRHVRYHVDGDDRGEASGCWSERRDSELRPRSTVSGSSTPTSPLARTGRVATGSRRSGSAHRNLPGSSPTVPSARPARVSACRIRAGSCTTWWSCRPAAAAAARSSPSRAAMHAPVPACPAAQFLWFRWRTPAARRDSDTGPTMASESVRACCASTPGSGRAGCPSSRSEP